MSRKNFSCLPVRLRTFSAILLCRPAFSIARAIVRPPRKRKLVDLKYVTDTADVERIPLFDWIYWHNVLT